MSEIEAAPEKLPHWDMSNVFSGLEGDDYRSACDRLNADLGELESYCDAHHVTRSGAGSAAGELPGTFDALAETLTSVLTQTNDILRRYETLEAFVYAFVSTDSYNAVAARELSKLELLDVRRQKLAVRLQGWIGSLSQFTGVGLPELIAGRKALVEHAFFLEHSARQSRYLMSEDLEALAAELCVDGGGAFGKLQGNVTSQLKVSFEKDGAVQELPITVVHNLCFSSDPGVRERAYRAEIKGWESARTTVAACLNGVKGTAVTLNRRRGRANALEAALDANRIDRPTLDALLDSIRESLPVFRRYLTSKARKLGKEKLPWWDLFAPVGKAEKAFTWREARAFLVEKFGRFSPELAEYAASAFDRRWIDAEPRDGKRGGAFCMGVPGVEESRILANFDGSFDQVSTLAHELGHGYHNHCQRGLEPLRRGAPMTLAETASIFCETLVAEAALLEASPQEQLAILEAQLTGATQVCLDIRSRYLFETAVLERRASGELSADDFCELMLAAQRETYADAVDESTYHRYMWLWKPHYYTYSQNFYNFPYAFGHLFGLGLYAVYRNEGAAFVPRYNELLRSTGQDYAAPLAARFGIDITRPDFWQKSLRIVEGQVERYEALG